MRRTFCGGCAGKGAHWRWCARVVGDSASFLGRYADTAEDLADRVGPNEPDAANLLYAASGRLRALAQRRAHEYQARPAEGPETA